MTVGSSSRPDMRRDLRVMVGLALLFASVPFWADGGLRFLAGVALVQVVFALSFNMVFGLTGLVSFGHAAYFACGAYAAGLLLQNNTSMSIYIVLVVGCAVGAGVALAIGFLALRRSSGIYFAILTLALAELLHILIAKSTLLGREDGLTGIVRPSLDFGIATVDLNQGNALYYLLLVVAGLSAIALWLLWNGAFGRRLSAIRQEPDRAAFLGINVQRSRLIVFTLSGAGSGLAGAMYAPLAQILTPELAHWTYSALPILFCLLGGSASFWGPVIGVLVFLGLEHVTRNIVGLSEIVTGLTLLLVVLAFPGGLVGGLQALLRRRPPAAVAAPATGDHKGEPA